jgi:predicted mannosyl-3-phosphoglycerate phosphatase (HAD superfamily)
VPDGSTGDSADRNPAIVVFTCVENVFAADSSGSVPTSALHMLQASGVPLILVGEDDADSVLRFQQTLQLVAPFICSGGAAIHVPPGYFSGVDGSAVPGRMSWQTYAFEPPDRAAAVLLLLDLFGARVGQYPLSVGIGCRPADQPLLLAVEVPIVVRDEREDQRSLLLGVPHAYLTKSTGLAGWSEALIGPPDD